MADLCNIAPPGEGSLDREQFLRLVEHLAAWESHGLRARCCVYFEMVLAEQHPVQTVYAGALGELVDLYDDEDLPGSPTKVWPAGRSWFVHTDWDQWGTTVCGDATLMQRLVDDSELETRVVRP